MKLAWIFLKPTLQIVGLLFGAYVAIDTWVVSKVHTETKPLKIELSEHIKIGEVRMGFVKESFERLERESIMMRNNQDTTNELLRKIAEKK